MKALGLLAAATLILESPWPVQAQILSARRLTQRIAPLLPPPPTNAPRRVVIQTPGRVAPSAAVSPESSRTGQRPLAEDPEPAGTNSPAKLIEIPAVPVVIQCQKVQPDPAESLQTVELSVTNLAPAALTEFTMRLVYLDRTGEKVKEWTTQRELDQPLSGKSAIELSQPAYFMPLITKRVKVEVLSARFADGTEWPPKTARPTSTASR